MKPNLLFLTNLYNDSAEEDIFLTKYLRKFFHVYISHPLDIASLEDNFDTVLIRNIWPTHEYEAEKTKFIRTLTKKGFMPKSMAERGYLTEKHYLEKQYLLELFTEGYPVIPSVDNIRDINKLGSSTRYFIKPKNKCDGVGSAVVSWEQLKRKKLKDYIIQPYIMFDYEVCFYFIDNVFVYAFSTPNRLQGKDYKEYIPSKKDLEFAKKFVKWNTLEYGLQRIDAVRVSNTYELLLTELEDLAPYLYLQELPKHIQRKALHALVKSIFKTLKKHAK